MKIALPSEKNSISPHFGRCPRFTIVEIVDGEIKSTVLAGGMGMRARELFGEKNIKVILGIEGDIDKILMDIKNDCLKEGSSSCSPGSGKGYGLEKPECDHSEEK